MSLLKEKISLENIKKLKIEIDWKNQKVNYEKVEFFDTPEERRNKKERDIRNKIVDYIKKQGGSCTFRLSRTIKNREVKKERDAIFNFLGCRQIDIIAQQLYSLLKEKKIYRYRLKKNHPFIYSFEPILEQKLSIIRPEKKIDTIKEKILEYIKENQPTTFRYAGTKDKKPAVSLTFSIRNNYKKKSTGLEESKKIKNLLETNNNKIIGRAITELVDAGKIQRERKNEYFPYIYSIVPEEIEKQSTNKIISETKTSKVKICPRCSSTMRISEDEDGDKIFYCLLCSERLYI